MKIYVPSHGQRILMPGNQPDWPLEGRAINEMSAYERRMVADGDLVLKPDETDDKTPAGKAGKGDRK